jgi:hypothetical protein
MKKLIIIFLLVAVGQIAAGQIAATRYYPTEKEAKKAIKDAKFDDTRWGIISYVEDHLGQKVGTGVCLELIVEAILNTDPKANKDSVLDGKDTFYKNENLISRKQILPGDIMIIRGGTKDTMRHIVIVYGFTGKDLYVAEQNTGETLDKSMVKIRKWDYKQIKKRYGDVDYYYLRYKKVL